MNKEEVEKIGAIKKLGSFGEYILAFGAVQAIWIDSRLLPRLTRSQRILFKKYVPAIIQRYFARRTGITIRRSAISGGHRLEIFINDTIIDAADFELTEKGWIKK